jgi:hypothetical protein
MSQIKGTEPPVTTSPRNDGILRADANQRTFADAPRAHAPASAISVPFQQGAHPENSPATPYSTRLQTLLVRPGHPIFDDEYQSWRSLGASHEEAATEAAKSTAGILTDPAALARWIDAHPEHIPTPEHPATDPASSAEPETVAAILLQNEKEIRTASSADAIGSARLMFNSRPPGGDHTRQAQAAALLAMRVAPAEYTVYQAAHPPPLPGDPIWERDLADAFEGMDRPDATEDERDEFRAKAQREATERLQARIQSFNWAAWFGAATQTTIPGSGLPTVDAATSMDPDAAPPKKKRGRKSNAERAAMAAGSTISSAAPSASPVKKKRPVSAAGSPAVQVGIADPLPPAVTEVLNQILPEPPEPVVTEAHRLEEDKRVDEEARALMGRAGNVARELRDVAPWQRLAVLDVVFADLAGYDAARRIDNMLRQRPADFPFEARHIEFDNDNAVLRLRDELRDAAHRAGLVLSGRLDRE